MLGNTYDLQDCGLAGALEIIGERWTLLIVRDAMFGVRRFSDFHVHLDIPRAVLADRLAGLVERGVLERVPDLDGRRASYRLTPTGVELWPPLLALLHWGSRHARPKSRIFRHAVCGTELSGDTRCPACQVVPALGDVETVPHPERVSRRDDPVSRALRAPHRMLTPLEPVAR